ncbi:MAG: hypothetical protein GTO18_07565 [Anaerolineales bacterium]|nr:hypothetical protein [Anaerolineales bacterium]
MNCPKCETENPDVAQFCQGCGERLSLLCVQCETVNAPSAKFCISCGAELGGIKEAEKDPRLSKLHETAPEDYKRKCGRQARKLRVSANRSQSSSPISSGQLLSQRNLILRSGVKSCKGPTAGSVMLSTDMRALSPSYWETVYLLFLAPQSHMRTILSEP